MVNVAIEGLGVKRVANELLCGLFGDGAAQGRGLVVVSLVVVVGLRVAQCIRGRGVVVVVFGRVLTVERGRGRGSKVARGASLVA